MGGNVTTMFGHELFNGKIAAFPVTVVLSFADLITFRIERLSDPGPIVPAVPVADLNHLWFRPFLANPASYGTA
jgi:hypothetical protein